jgi:hypothetical protein
MTLEELWNFILFILKKEQSGHISPDQRNSLLSVASKRRFEDELNQYQRTQNITDSLRAFFVFSTAASIDSNGQYTLPSTYRSKPSFGYVQTINAKSYYRDVDILTQSEYNTRMGSSISPPTEKHPFCILTGDTVQFQPLKSKTALFSYIRNPLEPYYDYYIDANEREVYKSIGILPYVVEGDTYSQLVTSSINITGVNSTNSDNYVLYWQLILSGGNYVFALYNNSDFASNHKVATGSISSTSGTINFVEANASGISGSIEVDYTQNDSGATNTITLPSCIIVGDSANQLSDFILSGVTLDNSDNGNLYWNITLGSYSSHVVDVYKDEAKTQAVATGNRNGDGLISLAALNSSGITGTVTIAYTAPDTDIYNLIVCLNQTVEMEWAYEDQLKIAGHILEMAGLPLEQDRVVKYGMEYKKIEV